MNSTKKNYKKLAEEYKKTTYGYCKRQATPSWADRKYIKLFYEMAKIEAARIGKPVEVDHIYPIRGKLVSGLHCEFNLQLLTAKANQLKNCK